jgi:hypothetical protein
MHTHHAERKRIEDNRKKQKRNYEERVCGRGLIGDHCPARFNR